MNGTLDRVRALVRLDRVDADDVRQLPQVGDLVERDLGR